MISAILLAAGQSKRMKGKNKLSEQIRGIPLIKHSVKNILDSTIDELIVVLGYEQESIKKLIGENLKIKFIFNKDFESGMASSIKVGLNNLSGNSTGFFICLGDMPMINKEIYNQLIKSIDQKEIIIPTYNGVQGNPVLFSKSMKNEIISIKGDLGAKKIIKSNKNKVLNLETNDQGVTIDFNTQDSFKL